MIVALNNKCNLNKEEFTIYQQQLQEIKTDIDLILCPSNIYLDKVNLTNMKLGAQNVSDKECGAYTGEVSASQLKSLDVLYCLVGHSERRLYQQETNEQIKDKVKRLLSCNIIPILCIGETEQERNSHQEKQVIEKDLKEVLQELTPVEQQKIIIAYEPIWSIGTGIIPTTEEISEIIEFIKTKYPHNKVLYGGSANEKNIDELKSIPNLDGYLVGGLSLKPEQLKIFLKKLKN